MRYQRTVPSDRFGSFERPVLEVTAGYLRFWGDDYPYLTEDRVAEQRWLPVPENSAAQGIVRRFNAGFRQ